MLLAVFLLMLNVGKTDGQVCFQAMDEFVDYCKTKHNGVVIGGRCFFLNLIAEYNWNIALKYCASQDGAVLAQIHTSNEMQILLDYATHKPSADGVWISLMRDPLPNGTTDFKQVYWLENSSGQRTRVPAANTWIRKYGIQDDQPTIIACYNIQPPNILDEDCSASRNVLCSVYNQDQNFTLIPDVCMKETIIETAMAANENDCATHCAQHTWCRSFNIYPSQPKCEFFSWYYNDTVSVENIPGCYHFAYVP